MPPAVQPLPNAGNTPWHDSMRIYTNMTPINMKYTSRAK